MKGILLLLLLFNIYVCNVIIGSFSGVKNFNIPAEIVKIEQELRNSPEQNYGAKMIYNSARDFGRIILVVLKPNVSVRGSSNDPFYFRSINGQFIFKTRIHNYTMNPKDGILFPGGLEHVITNSQNKFSSYYRLTSPAVKSDIIANKLSEYPKSIDTSRVKDFNLGRFFVYDKPEVNLNEIAKRLISQGVRLTSNTFGFNSGISCTMFVLRGISGCHKHTRSDYISFNGVGGSYHKIKNPHQFDTFENEAVVLVKDLDHNLISHKDLNGNNDFNVMLIFQFPSQGNRSDSGPATDCTN